MGEHLTRAKPEYKASELLEYQNQLPDEINKERSSKHPISNLVGSGAFPFLKTEVACEENESCY